METGLPSAAPNQSSAVTLGFSLCRACALPPAMSARRNCWTNRVELSALSVSPFWLSHVEVDAAQFSTKFRRWTSERFTVWYREYLSSSGSRTRSGETLHCWERS
jgi:hypothetical protein